MSADLLHTLDKRRVAETFGRAAANYDAHDFLQREVAARALERLEVMTLEPRCVIDLGSGTGRGALALATRYKGALVVHCDLALPMLQAARRRSRRLFSRHRYVCADAERLPFRAGAADLVFSSLALQWCTDLGAAFAGARHALRTGGLFLFSTLGPDTLRELREAWSTVSEAPRVNRFFDMHDIGDALVAAGFADPVMEAESITVTYDDALSVMRDLKAIGASNAAPERPRGLLGRARLKAVATAYEAFRTDGKLPATYEVVYGHAWVPEGPPPQRGAVHTFDLDQLKRRS